MRGLAKSERWRKKFRSTATGGVLASFLLVSLSIPAQAAAPRTPIDVAGATITFPNEANIGANAALNASVTYPQVAVVGGTTIGATVTVKALENIVAEEVDDAACTDLVVRRIDRFVDDQRSNDPLRTNIRVCPTRVGFVELEVNFFVDAIGGPEPQPLRNLKANFDDVDNRQFLWVYGADSFRLPVDTKLTVDQATAGVTKFLGPTGSAEPTETAAEVTWNETSTITFRFGRDRTGSSSGGFANVALSFVAASFESVDDSNDDTGPETPAETGAAPTATPDDAARTTPAPRVVAEPAIALNPEFSTGDIACGGTVLTNGEGLLRDSSRSLNLSGQGVLDSGIITGSAFESRIALPAALPAGAHNLTLSATGRDGSLLSLTYRFVVDTNCRVTEASSTAGHQLAQTGATGVVIMAALSASAVGAGIAFVLLSRRNTVLPRI